MATEREIEFRLGGWKGKWFDPNICKRDFDIVYKWVNAHYKPTWHKKYNVEYYEKGRVQTDRKTKESSCIKKDINDKITLRVKGSRYDVRYVDCNEVPSKPVGDVTKEIHKEAFRYDLGGGNWLDMHVYTPKHGSVYYGIEIETKWEFDSDEFGSVWDLYYKLMELMEPEIKSERTIVYEC